MAPAAPAADGYLMVVDDSPSTLHFLEDRLRQHGFRVRVFAAGRPALAAAERKPPDLIMLDVNLPDLSGYEVCDQLKRSPLLKGVPVLFMSTLDQTTDKLRAFDVGGVDYIRKPFQFEEVEARIHTHLELRRLRRELESRNGQLEELVGLRTQQLEAQSRELLRQNQALHNEIAERKLEEQARAKLEAQLRQAQKMEAIGTLAGGIAHDFNNILGIIIAYAELAQTDVGPLPAARESLGEVLKAADRAKDLVRQILAFSRQSKAERLPIRLQPLLKEGLKLLRSTIPSTIDIISRVDPAVPPVLADPVQIHQVLINLCTNSAHAMRDHVGRLEIELTAFAADAEFLRLHPGLLARQFARLRVSDTGHGMDARTLQRLFERFFTTKAPGEGTGLGLAVVQGIVKEHRGAITVESQPGQGTTFHVYFPTSDTPLPAGPSPTGPGAIPRGQGQRILLVDDEQHLTSLSKPATFLTRLGYAVTTHNSPLEALEDFKHRPAEFDLIFSDLSMPKMTGLDLARQVLEIRHGLPFLLATGFADAWAQDEVRKLGLAGLVLKPMTPAHLANAVHEALLPGRGAPKAPAGPRA